MLTRTRLVTSAEPDPLAMVTIRTMSSLFPSFGDVLGRIDAVLHTPSLNLLSDASRYRTRLQYEPEPLNIPAGRQVKDDHSAQVGRALSGATAHLDKSLDDLQRWLGTGLSEVCAAAGLNRTTVYAWRRRASSPRPGTVSSILRLHGLVSSAVASAGETSAKQWFHNGQPSPLERLTTATGDSAAMTAVGRDLRRALTAPPLPPPNPLLNVTLDDSPARPLT